MARHLMAPGFLALILFLSGPVAAVTVSVPSLVLQPSVPFALSGAAAGAGVNLTVGTVNRQVTAVTGADTFTLSGVASGWQPWAARVQNGSSTQSFSGRVYVDGTVAALASQVTALAHDVDDLKDQQTTDNASTADLLAQMEAVQLRMNHTANQILDALLAATRGGANLEVNVTQAMRLAAADVLAASQSEKTADIADTKVQATAANAQSSTAATWALYATIAAVAATLMMIAVGLLLFQQIQKTRGDFLVYVLALAAKSGLTPESPEFQQALAATGHKPKPPKAPKEPKPKKEKKPKKDKKADKK